VKHLLTAAALCCAFTVSGGSLPDVLARFGDVELKKERFQLFDLPAEKEQRRRQLKKLVDTEVMLIIIRDLLSRSGIAPDLLTARRYVAMRKKQFAGKVPENLFSSLENSVSKPDFQLKSALYFTFYAAVPEAVEPSAEDVRRHYELNKEQFLLPVDSVLAMFRGGRTPAESKQNAPLILARLRQGEDFYALAKQFDPEGKNLSAAPEPELRPYFKKVMQLPANAFTDVETPKGTFIVKVVSKSEKKYRPFGETALYITEMLSSQKLKNALEQYMREILAKKPVRYFFQ
jgi:hypothetical protein